MNKPELVDEREYQAALWLQAEALLATAKWRAAMNQPDGSCEVLESLELTSQRLRRLLTFDVRRDGA